MHVADRVKAHIVRPMRVEKMDAGFRQRLVVSVVRLSPDPSAGADPCPCR
jgi:hypothetical protein